MTLTPQAKAEADLERLRKFGLGDIHGLVFPLSESEINNIVGAALEEDYASNDVTTLATIVSGRRSRAVLVARTDGVISGIPLALAAFRLRDTNLVIDQEAKDGDHVKAGAIILRLTGDAHGLLSAERVALNFMQRLSGVSSLTAKYVAAVNGTSARILDTRKTTPGWRLLEKYAVRCGGGLNHRNDLSAAVLIKDNHLAAVGGDVEVAVRRAREFEQTVRVEVECDTLDQVRDAVKAGADVIMLDNMSPELMLEAVAHINKRAVVEASGGVTLSTVRDIAMTGVDWISVGALTHSAPALDLALDLHL